MSFSSFKGPPGGGFHHFYSYNFRHQSTFSKKHPLRVAHYLSCRPFLGNMISRTGKIRCSCPNAIWFSAANTFHSPCYWPTALSQSELSIHDHLSLVVHCLLSDAKPTPPECRHFQDYCSEGCIMIVRTISALIRSQLFPTFRRAI